MLIYLVSTYIISNNFTVIVILFVFYSINYNLYFHVRYILFEYIPPPKKKKIVYINCTYLYVFCMPVLLFSIFINHTIMTNCVSINYGKNKLV